MTQPEYYGVTLYKNGERCSFEEFWTAAKWQMEKFNTCFIKSKPEKLEYDLITYVPYDEIGDLIGGDY